MREKVEAALEKIRPALQADGGDVELVDSLNTRLEGHGGQGRVARVPCPP